MAPGAAQESVLVVCAHPDDEVFGPGGTVARYSREGKTVRAVIFTYGEDSHPWQKSELTQEVRIRESKRAAGILGYKECLYLGLKEGKILDELHDTDLSTKLKRLIEKFGATKIITHSPNDPHPDHRATYQVVRAVAASLRTAVPVYTFDIWTVVSFRHRGRPTLVVDISGTFSTKIRALRCFKSQQFSLLSLLWSVYLKALLTGVKNNCRYAEAFHRAAIVREALT